MRQYQVGGGALDMIRRVTDVPVAMLVQLVRKSILNIQSTTLPNLYFPVMLYIWSTFQHTTFTSRQPFNTCCKDQRTCFHHHHLCQLVISAPVQLNTLIRDNYNLCNCQNVSEQQVQRFLQPVVATSCQIIELLINVFSVV